MGDLGQRRGSIRGKMFGLLYRTRGRRRPPDACNASRCRPAFPSVPRPVWACGPIAATLRKGARLFSSETRFPGPKRAAKQPFRPGATGGPGGMIPPGRGAGRPAPGYAGRQPRFLFSLASPLLLQPLGQHLGAMLDRQVHLQVVRAAAQLHDAAGAVGD